MAADVIQFICQYNAYMSALSTNW